jgi:hypothetical protein
LHDWPLLVTVHPDACACACARSRLSPKDGRVPVLAAAGGGPATIAEFKALKSSAEIACACACDTLLWLEPPQVIDMSEIRVRAAIAHATRRVGFECIEGLLLVDDSENCRVTKGTTKLCAIQLSAADSMIHAAVILLRFTIGLQ